MEDNSILMPNNSNRDCEIAQHLAENLFLRYLLALRLATALFGLIFCVALFRFLSKQLAFHRNAEILWTNHTIWAVIDSATNIVVRTFYLVRYVPKQTDPCKYLFTGAETIIVYGPTLLSSYGQIWSLATMAVERLSATVNYRAYEKTKGTTGIVLTLIQWILSMLCFGVNIIDFDWTSNRSSLVISNIKSSSRNSIQTFILAAIEMMAICMFYVLLRVNQRLRKSQVNASLTERYQVDENIRSIFLMMPMIITHFICFIPSLGGVPIYMLIDPYVRPENFTIFYQIVSTSSYYTFIFPIILFWRHRVLRTQLRKAMGVFKVTPEPPRADGRTAEQVQHFNILQKMWTTENN